MDDGGGGGEDLMDPSLLEGAMGGGNNIYGKGEREKFVVKSLELQTLYALQELGIVVGVTIMVAFIFLLMVYTEKLFNGAVSKYHKRFGEPPTEMDAEDPAALVGTFKRYKN
jgi:hypothetical protein